MKIEEEVEKGGSNDNTLDFSDFDNYLENEKNKAEQMKKEEKHFDESSINDEDKSQDDDDGFVDEEEIDFLDDDEEYECDFEYDELLREVVTVSENKEEVKETGVVSYSENYKEEFQDFDEVNDDDFMDAQEESLLYSTSSDSVSFDDLDDGSVDAEKEDDEDDDDYSSKKNPYKPIGGGSKPGKLIKSRILLVILGFIIIVFTCVYLFVNKKQAEEAERGKEEDYLNIEGYNPDFGDYKNRAYKGEDVDDDSLKKIESILTGDDKEHFVKEEKKEEAPKPVVTNSAPSSSAPVSDRYQERVEAGLRVNGEGFGFKTRGNYSGDYGNAVSSDMNGYGYGYNDYSSESYIDRLNSISGALQGSGDSGNGKKVDTKRSFNDGNYDRNAGTSVSAIADNSLYPGTIIHAVMINGINTDYPGNITARVINNVYDSKTGKKLLIPSGSILRGSYSSASIGLNRIQIAWQTLIMNRDGKDYIVNLGSMVGVDKSGYSGIKGTLNDHAFSYLKAAGISSLFTYINSNIFEVSNAQKNKTVQEMIAGSQEIGNKLADKILDRALDIEPTVKVRPGTRISVDVDTVLTLVPYERDMPVQKYIRK